MILTSTEVRQYLGISSSSLDATFDMWIPIVLQDFFDYTNNYFEDLGILIRGRGFTFSTAGTITAIGTNFSTWSFASSDNIRVYGSARNDGVYEASVISSATITISSLQTLKSEDQEKYIEISKINFPISAKPVLAQMIKYKMDYPNGTPISESLGDYSITYGNSGGYHDGINSALSKWVNVKL